MRKLFYVFPAAVILLLSCQKEKSLENPDTTTGGGNTAGSGLLTRVVNVAGTDSNSVDYGYDGNKRLVTVIFTSTQGGNQFIQLYRNSAGILTRFTTKSDDLITAGIDSIVTVLSFDAAKSRYAYGISTIKLPGLTYVDSTIYNYDGAGKLINKTAFGKADSTAYQISAKSDYSFNTGNNIAIEKYYTYDASITDWDLVASYNYTYDDKVNPLQLGTEGPIVLDDVTYASANNPTAFDYLDDDDPTKNYSVTTTYTYDSTSKPSAGTAVESSGSGTYALRYYYN